MRVKTQYLWSTDDFHLCPQHPGIYKERYSTRLIIRGCLSRVSAM